jgi:hypothetical protein
MEPSDALSPSPTGYPTCVALYRRQVRTYNLSVPASGLLSRVGRGDAFNPQMRFNRFVFLNRPVLSLETHLGVTTSPQAPLPADFVTLSVFDKSPPLRLTLSRSRERSCYKLMHSKHARALVPLMRRGSTASRRTIRHIAHPGTIHPPSFESPIQNVLSNRLIVLRIGRYAVGPAVYRS